MKRFDQLAREHIADWRPYEKRALARALRQAREHERAMRVTEITPEELELEELARDIVRQLIEEDSGHEPV